MALVRVEPTNVDVAIADAISGRTRPGPERAAKALTWGADEHILCALAAGWWPCCRGKDADCRRASDHVLLTTLVSSALPHLLKVVFDHAQEAVWHEFSWYGCAVSLEGRKSSRQHSDLVK
jgi:hypothetical protein